PGFDIGGIFGINLPDKLRHWLRIGGFPGLLQPFAKLLLMLLHLLEPIGVAVQEIISEKTPLTQQGGGQFLRGLKRGHVLVDEGNQEGVHGARMPEGDQAAPQGGADQGSQQQEDAGPQTEPFPHNLTQKIQFRLRPNPSAETARRHIQKRQLIYVTTKIRGSPREANHAVPGTGNLVYFWAGGIIPGGRQLPPESGGRGGFPSRAVKNINNIEDLIRMKSAAD